MDPSNNIIELLENINITDKDKKSNKNVKNKDCVELKNLEFKNVMMYGNGLKPKCDTDNVTFLEELLEKETQMNKLDMWTKIDKTDKIIKLKKYANVLVEKYNLNTEEETSLNNYLLHILERKYISKIKDVVYNREMGIIENIPNLIFNSENRRFFIKKNDKHVNTLKSLGPKKNKTQKF